MNNTLLSRFVGVPSFVAPEFRARFEMALSSVASHPDAPKLLAGNLSTDDFWPEADDWRAAYRPYVVRDGILFIPVKGVLLHDFPWSLGSWATGYVYIAKAIERGLADANVKGIALVGDSYGGEVAGCFELVDRIYAARGQKPIRAFAHEYAYSAGYAVLSAADTLTVSRTGGVGSIGVVCAHVDISDAMKAYGMKITFIFAGKHKVDGNAYEPLPDDEKARIQAEIDECYAIFTGAVARNRAMDEDAVRATEALCFTAKKAVSNGLADSIGPLDDAVAAFAADLSSPDDEGEEEMSKTQSAGEPAATTDTKPAASKPVVAAPAAAAPAAEASTEQQPDAATAERTRIKGIMGLEEAKGRTALAEHFAYNMAMSVDDAKKALAAAPVSAPESANRFDQAMHAAGNPKVGADADAPAGQTAEVTNRVLSHYRAVTGAQPRS
ncbi:MAG: S49 family peptidase [Pseudolabrys sp.]